MTTACHYTIRVSPRAKHVRLQVSARDGVVVVVPKGFDQAGIPEFVQRWQRWIEAALEELEQRRAAAAAAPVRPLPERIALPAIGQEWSVEYQPMNQSWVTAVPREGQRLVVSGNVAEHRLCREVLRRWMQHMAQRHLAPQLGQLAEENGFQVKRVLVRAQKTRWASCSGKQTVSINQNALFLPPQLVRYILIHELCHTVHLNHSPRFWALVAAHVPDYRDIRREMRTAWKLMPEWVARGPGR
jgi:predicted metal-dependent hydrolase